MQRAKKRIALCLIPVMLFNTLAMQPALAGFSTEYLLKSGIKGMFDSGCGGYCVVGVCAHLVIKISLSGVEYYTIISPKLRHPVPDMVVSAYPHPGNEPWDEWRNTFGRTVSVVNRSLIARVLGTPDGLQGGRADQKDQDEHQSVSFKEVDVIGHPAALIPRIFQRSGINLKPTLSHYRVPSARFLPKPADAAAVDAKAGKSEFNLSAMLNLSLTRTLQAVRDGLVAFLETADLIETIKRIVDLFTVIDKLMEFYNNVLRILEVMTRSTIYGSLINPRFEAPRLFCPSSVMPFQPYYLSYADALFWRTGFPITDGPISGADHSLTILNPFSTDILGKGMNQWGHLYPRDGTVNTNHDAKAASVAAWRGLDVMKTDAGKSRIGVVTPIGYTSGSDRWQMIYPVERRCTTSPYYSDDGADKDFMSITEEGSYAWNYYHIYECCSNTRGTKILEVPLPAPLCLELPI